MDPRNELLLAPFENAYFAKIALPCRRERDFQGLEPSKINQKIKKKMFKNRCAKKGSEIRISAPFCRPNPPPNASQNASEAPPKDI